MCMGRGAYFCCLKNADSMLFQSSREVRVPLGLDSYPLGCTRVGLASHPNFVDSSSCSPISCFQELLRKPAAAIIATLHLWHSAA